MHSTRGAYGFSANGLDWTLGTLPLESNASAWDMELRRANGTSTPLARRQRPSLLRDPHTGRPTHLITGADFGVHGPGDGAAGTGWCEGCHWGQGLTLIQPLV